MRRPHTEALPPRGQMDKVELCLDHKSPKIRKQLIYLPRCTTPPRYKRTIPMYPPSVMPRHRDQARMDGSSPIVPECRLIYTRSLTRSNEYRHHWTINRRPK